MSMQPSYVASDILVQYWDLALPVNPLAIARDMGLTRKNGGILSSDQRLRIACKIGRIILKKADKKDVLRFAATLLIPSLAVRTMIELRKMQFRDLCLTFDVSEDLMARRLLELGLESYGHIS